MKNGQRSFTSEKWKVRLSYWTLNMVFHFEESHYIPLQMEIAIWLQTKISQSLYRTEHFLTFSGHIHYLYSQFITKWRPSHL